MRLRVCRLDWSWGMRIPWFTIFRDWGDFRKSGDVLSLEKQTLDSLPHQWFLCLSHIQEEQPVQGLTSEYIRRDFDSKEARGPCPAFKVVRQLSDTRDRNSPPNTVTFTSFFTWTTPTAWSQVYPFLHTWPLNLSPCIHLFFSVMYLWCPLARSEAEFHRSS